MRSKHPVRYGDGPTMIHLQNWWIGNYAYIHVSRIQIRMQNDKKNILIMFPVQN